MLNFNQVRCPKILMRRIVKQHGTPGLESKGEHCCLHCTSEVVFSFLENVDLLKDGAHFHNTKLIPYALEWGYGIINLQNPLSKLGNGFRLPAGFWDKI